MPEIRCDINAGMERSFYFKTNGQPCDISRSATQSVYFEIENPNTSDEKRYLRVVDRSSGMEKLKVQLNENGGGKPLHGNTGQHEPHRRSNPHLNIAIDTDKERVFFAEKNLSADQNIQVFLRIFPKTHQDDKKRYLTFIQTGVALTVDLEDADLNRAGGKKPLGGGDAFASDEDLS